MALFHWYLGFKPDNIEIETKDKKKKKKTIESNIYSFPPQCHISSFVKVYLINYRTLMPACKIPDCRKLTWAHIISMWNFTAGREVRHFLSPSLTLQHRRHPEFRGREKAVTLVSLIIRLYLSTTCFYPCLLEKSIRPLKV